jgi:uncharacterized protein YndB with AHSA1/START domain
MTTATATVEVPCDPDTAFDIFTRDIGAWWKRGTRYWNDAAKGLTLRLEPEVGGRLVEVYDLETGEGFDIGRVLAWEPGKRLVFTWRQGNWSSVEQIGAWRDERSDRLVGLALWESAEAFHASVERIFQAVADDPFDQWLQEPPDVFYLSQP